MKKIATMTLAALVTTTLAACGESTETSTPEPAVTAGGTANGSDAPADAASPTAPAAEDSASAAPSNEAAPAKESSAPEQAPAASGPGSAEDAAAAREAALSVIQGIVIAQDLDDDRKTWDVDILAGDKVHDIKVTIADGTAKEEETEDLDDDDRAAGAAQVRIEQAIEKALEDTPGVVDDVSWDDGRWEVEVEADGKDVELTIDPATGEVSHG